MKQRFLTAALAGVFFLVLALIGGIPFTVLTVMMALVGYAELLRMKKIRLYSFPGWVGGILIVLLVFPLSFFTSIDPYMTAFLLMLAYTVLSKNRFSFGDAGFTGFAALYVAFGFHYLAQVRLEHGAALMFFILFVIWATDSGAYFSGNRFGRRKLWPQISPNKTVEGAVGGILAGLVIAAVYQLFLSVYASMGVALLAALVITVFGQLGDLVESAFKRRYGVKDSGNLLPGHGGILDRCDSWLFVLPILHLLHFI
ncbi:MAG TPA: phosphatidate cytidylyltransferase [Bacillales bacterium]|nr:phosphatidate cytidylyltransferase [Bacillales bacterium]